MSGCSNTNEHKYCWAKQGRKKKKLMDWIKNYMKSNNSYVLTYGKLYWQVDSV